MTKEEAAMMISELTYDEKIMLYYWLLSRQQNLAPAESRQVKDSPAFQLKTH